MCGGREGDVQVCGGTECDMEGEGKYGRVTK